MKWNYECFCSLQISIQIVALIFLLLLLKKHLWVQLVELSYTVSMMTVSCSYSPSSLFNTSFLKVCLNAWTVLQMCSAHICQSLLISSSSMLLWEDGRMRIHALVISLSLISWQTPFFRSSKQRRNLTCSQRDVIGSTDFIKAAHTPNQEAWNVQRNGNVFPHIGNTSSQTVQGFHFFHASLSQELQWKWFSSAAVIRAEADCKLATWDWLQPIARPTAIKSGAPQEDCSASTVSPAFYLCHRPNRGFTKQLETLNGSWDLKVRIQGKQNQ